MVVDLGYFYAMEDAVMRKFFQATHDLSDAAESGMSLTDIDLICLENYVALLHITLSKLRRQADRAQTKIQNHPLSSSSH
jgi:hypothetical protein